RGRHPAAAGRGAPAPSAIQGSVVACGWTRRGAADRFSYRHLANSLSIIQPMQEAKLPRAGVDAHPTLMQLLDERGARYRLIDHPPEGRTELVSPMRGHEPRLAAKCMVLM